MPEDSNTAVCLAGEVRALLLEQVSTYLKESLLRPLHADLFMVVSLEETKGWHTWTNNHSSVAYSKQALHAMRRVLLPTQMIVVRDGAELHTAAHKLYLDEESSNCTKGLHSFQALFLRWSVCLKMIEQSESRRLSPLFKYTYVVRSRPDIYLAGVFSSSLLHQRFPSPNSRWIAYAWDFIAIMSRSAADTSLRQCSLMKNASECWLANPDNYTLRSNFASQKIVGEFCNPCVCKLAGINTYEISLRRDHPFTVNLSTGVRNLAHAVRQSWERANGVQVARLPHAPPHGMESALQLLPNAVRSRRTCFSAEEPLSPLNKTLILHQNHTEQRRQERPSRSTYNLHKSEHRFRTGATSYAGKEATFYTPNALARLFLWFRGTLLPVPNS